MSDTRRLALELHEIRQLALGHATNPQFGNSSVDGEGLSFRDGDGNEIGRIGGDGGNGLEIRYVDAPKPLPPTAPVATGDANLIRVEWDGGWVRIEGGTPVRDLDAIDAPAVDRVEVHVSMDENFVPDPVLSFAGVLPVTQEGGAHTVGPLAEAGDYYVVLMARGKDGQYSAPSERTHVVTTVGLMESELFDLALRADEARESADGKNTVHYGEEPVAPEGGFSEGDLWFDTTEDPETGFRKNTPHLWDPFANNGEGGWVSAADSRVDAIRDAQDALREDVERIVTDGAGATTYWLPAKPGEATDPPPREGDLWFDTSESGGNALHRFDGQGWVSASDSRFQTLQDAQDDFASRVEQELSDVENAASDAQQAADDALAAINAGDALWGDPGFEVGYGPIGDTHPDINRSTVHAYQGAWSIEYTTNGDGALIYPGLTVASVTPGRVYRLSAAVRSDDGLTFQSWVQQRAADGSLVRAEDHFNVPGGVGSWALGSEIYEIAEGVAALRLSPLVPASDNGTAGQKLYLDNFTLTDITDGYEQYREAILAAQDAQETAGEAKALAEAAVGAAEGGNTNFFNTSPPTGVGSLVGDRWFQRDTGHAIIGMWLWDGDNWVRQTLNNEVIGNLDAGKITTGHLEGARIKAGSITADRLVVGVSQNMLVDSLFKNAEINAARATAVWQPVAHGVETHFEASGSVLNQSLYLTTDGSPNAPETRLAVDSNTSWSVQVDVKVGEGAASIDRMFYSFVGFRADGSGRFSTALLNRPGGGTQVTSADGWVRMTAEYDWSAVGDVVMVAPRLLVTQGGGGGGTYSIRNPFVGEQSGATLIKDGAITTDKIAVGAITAESGVVESLDAGDISVGELDAARIGANTITADKMLVGPRPDNMIVDVAAVTGETAPHQAVDGSTLLMMPGITGIDGYNPGPHLTARSSASPGEGTNRGVVAFGTTNGGTRAPVEPSTDYALSGLVRVGSRRPHGTPNVHWAYTEYDHAGVSLGTTHLGDSQTVAGWDWSQVVGEFTTQQATSSVEILLSCNQPSTDVRIVKPAFRPKVGTTLIEDGAITTEKIAVGAITAESGIIGSLDAGVITTGELRGELIRAQSIAGESLAVDAIDGKTITGATIRTSSAGARVELDASGLRQYNLAGQPIVDMTGGNVTVMGALYSGQPGFSRVQIDNQLWPGGQYVPREDGSMAQVLGAGMRVGREAYHAVDVFHGSYDELDGTTGEAAVVRGPGESAVNALYMTNSGKAWWRSTFADERRVDMMIIPENSTHQVTSERGGSRYAASAQRAWQYSGGSVFGHHQVWATASNHSASVQMDLGQPSGLTEAGMEFRVERSGTSGTGIFTLGSTYARMGHGSGYVSIGESALNGATITMSGARFRFSGIADTSNPANAYISQGGYISRESSSRKLKIAEKPVEAGRGDGQFDDALLSVPVVTWFDRKDAEALADYQTAVHEDEWPSQIPDEITPLRRIPGVFAEDVDQAGLSEFVEYAESGEAKAVHYSRLGVALIPVVRRLRDRVDELERKMGEMANA